jgi:hypothetical protein
VSRSNRIGQITWLDCLAQHCLELWHELHRIAMDAG